jgi:hypothetical protein
MEVIGRFSEVAAYDVLDDVPLSYRRILVTA